MNRRKRSLVLPILCLGLAILFQAGCIKHYLVFGDFQKVITYASNHQKLEFVKYKATFIGPTPCAKGAYKDLTECKIDVPGGEGIFRYECTPECQDPEVEVGSDIKSNSTAIIPVHPTVTTAPDKVVSLWCDAHQVKVAPQQATIHSGQYIGFATYGTPNQKLPSWSVAATTFCDGATPVDDQHPVCKAATVASSTAFSYTVTDTRKQGACMPASGNTITVLP